MAPFSPVRAFLLTGLAGAGWVALSGCDPVATPLPEIRIRDQVVVAELALTEAQRRGAVQDRTSLRAGRGVLLVYPDEAARTVSAEKVVIPLSMAFVRSNGLISEIVDLPALSRGRVTSREPARYVLIVPAGWFGSHHIEEGDRVELPADAAHWKADP